MSTHLSPIVLEGRATAAIIVSAKLQPAWLDAAADCPGHRCGSWSDIRFCSHMSLHYSSRLVTIPQGSKVQLQDANTLPPEARKTCLDNDSMMISPLVV